LALNYAKFGLKQQNLVDIHDDMLLSGNSHFPVSVVSSLVGYTAE